MSDAMQRFADDLNEQFRAQATSCMTIMYALLDKGVITPEEMEAAREKAKKIVDKHFGPTPEEKLREQLATFMKASPKSEAV
ncbi:MAG: hypothetical protein EBR82_67175 [Caulobacteraceae bacterium]|nr:hypothetical protein [Caulobacteraceae bacterium]